MRTNVEDDLWDSGRLSKLARSLQIREPLALGLLICVYRRTQKALIVTETIDRLITSVVVDFDSDDEARHFIRAMVVAKLATESSDGNLITIKGNDTHVRRLADFRDRASMGGKASVKKAQSFRKPTLEPALEHMLNTPSSLLRSPSSDLQTETEIRDPCARDPEPEARVPSTDDLSTIAASQIPGDQVLSVYESWRSEMQSVRKIPMPLIASATDKHAIRSLIHMSGSVAIATEVARAFVHCDDPKGYFKRVGWPLWLLGEVRNFTEARTKASRMMARTSEARGLAG